MYKANNSGRFRARSGVLYKFFPGWIIDAPNGELYGCAGVEWIGKGKEKKPKTKAKKKTIVPE